MNDQNTQQNDKKTRNRIITVISIIVLIIIIIILLLRSCSCEGEFKPEDVLPTTPRVTEDPNAGDYQEPVLGETTGSVPGVAIAGFGTWTIPPETTECVIDLTNPEANEGYYDMTFELRLLNDSAEGYEVLYTSGLVHPGQHIQKVTLPHGLAAGEYEMLVHVQPYFMDENQTPTNNADFKANLIVK